VVVGGLVVSVLGGTVVVGVVVSMVAGGTLVSVLGGSIVGGAGVDVSVGDDVVVAVSAAHATAKGMTTTANTTTNMTARRATLMGR